VSEITSSVKSET